DEAAGWNECGLVGSACAVADPDPLIEELAALQQRYSTSSASSSTTNVADKVRGSYQILSGSPWLLPRPLFVLAQEQLTTGQATLYTLQTRVQQELVQDELAMVEVMEVDSRQLFLLTGPAEAVVVYLPWSEFQPMPQQLAETLRQGEQAGGGAGL
ncbi:hypothetical protein TSOC_004181, partial [Tetrabaena socialis]